MIRAWLLMVSILGFPLLAQAQDPSIVVVEVDQKTQEPWGLFTPEYRKHFGSLVQALQSKGVKVIASTYNFLPDPTVETQTAAFVVAAKESGADGTPDSLSRRLQRIVEGVLRAGGGDRPRYVRSSSRRSKSGGKTADARHSRATRSHGGDRRSYPSAP